MRKLTATLCLTLAVLLGSMGCQSTLEVKNSIKKEIIVATSLEVKNCRLLSDVHGTSGWYGVFASQGISNARNEAFENAKKLDATHLVWTQTSVVYGSTSVSGNAYRCDVGNLAKNPLPKKSPPPSSGSTGSGFFVSKLGHIITNEHVVRQCGSVTVGDNANKQVTATVLETDERNDLALLRISSTQMASAETKSLISKLGLKLIPLASEGLFKSEDVELGEDVLVAGFPHGDFYSDGIKVTRGIVSGKKGMGDDRGQFQMDAAVQKGNSGGPIYDENGNIVGVVVSQLDPLKVAKAIGSLPQNVNFGIKASTVRQFLTSAGIPTKWSNRTQRKSFREVAQIADKQTVMVVCNP